MKNPTMKTLLTEWRQLLKEGDHLGHVAFFRPDGEPTQQEHAILQYYSDGSNEYDQTIPQELSDMPSNKVHTIGNLAFKYFEENVPLEEAQEACKYDFGHTDDITFLGMDPEEVSYAYSVFDRGGIY